MIDKLIKEMHTECHYCDGTGIELDDERQYELGSEGLCHQCNGSGKGLSWDGEKLRHLILNGELP